MDRNDEIFKGKSLNDIFKDIYNKSSEKDRQIKMLIGELRPLITNIGDATVIVPLIKEYMEVAIRNDDAIVKMAAIVQRLIGSTNRNAGTEGGSLLSEEEKKQLLSELDEIEADVQDSGAEDIVQQQIDNVKKKLKPPTKEEDEEE